MALARGGGGGDYGGGGSGGGGSGGGGGGGGGDASFLIDLLWLLLRYPKVGVPVLLIVVIFAVVGGKKGRGAYQGSVIRRGTEALVGSQREAALAQVTARDPTFDEAAFLARAKTAFTKVQDAWCAHDLAPMRPFVSDGIHERFALQTAEQEALGYRDRMDDLVILGAGLAQVVTEGPFDVVTVAIRARARDYRVSVPDGKKIRGTDLPEEFVEYWSFLRRKGRATKPGQAGLIEGQCPNCGAAIEMNQWSKCTYCQAMLRSGEFDWVLAEITQAVEWRDTPPSAVPGVAALRAKDPDFDLQHLEDRTSVMFWRWAMSERAGSVAPLRKIASPAAVEAFAQRLAAGRGATGSRAWTGERAVGSVETVGLTSTPERDRALVEVRWQGTAFTAAADGVPVRGEQGSDPVLALLADAACGGEERREHECLLGALPELRSPGRGRRVGRLRALRRGDERRTQGLGARRGALPAVARRGGGARGDRGRSGRGGPAEPAAAGWAPRRVEAGSRPPVRAACLGWLVQMMRADGEIDERERDVLRSVARKAGMREAALDELVEANAGAALARPSGPLDLAEAGAWMEVLAEVALADGRLDPAELQLLRELGEANGLAKADVGMIVARTRTRLYRDAKVALR